MAKFEVFDRQEAKARESVALAEGFADALRSRREREGVSLQALAMRSGVSASHLNRLERGERASASRQTLERLVRATGWSELCYAAGRIPADMEAEISGLGAKVGEARLRTCTALLLRRAMMEAEAERFAAEHRVPERNLRVDVNALVSASGLSKLSVEYIADHAGSSKVHLSGEGTAVISVVAGTGDTSFRLRFLYAHAASHKLLGHSMCCYPQTTDDEEDATELACILLAPGALVERAVRGSLATHDPWDPGTGDVVSRIASAMALPVWITAKRLNDLRILEIDAEATA